MNYSKAYYVPQTDLTPDSDGQNRLANLPRFEILSKLDNIPNLNDFDVERNVIEEVNFGNYTPQQFEEKINGNDSYYKNNFSVFHCKVRSLSANYDDLYKLLTYLAFPFSIIGLSETKILHDVRQISNTDIFGYDFISQPTPSNAGGVGFYVKHGLQYHIRDETTSDLGTLSGSSNRIYINDSLSPNNKNLFKECLKLKRKEQFQFIWTHYGRIYLRKDSNSATKAVCSQNDLEKIRRFNASSHGSSISSGGDGWH